MVALSSTTITKTVVDRLKPGQTIWDAKLKGFGVRCQATGKSYILKKAVQGKVRWITIGADGAWTLFQARKEAEKLIGEIAQGKDPRAAESGKRLRVSELCQRYLEHHAIPNKKASSVKLDQMNIRNHILPLIGDRFVDGIQARDVEAFKNDVRIGTTAPKNVKAKQREQGGGIVVTGGPGVSNRCLTLLSKMFNLAELWGLRPGGSNPVKGVTRHKEHPKERFLTENEFRTLATVLTRYEQEGSISIYATTAIRILIVTGARLSEILSLRWEDVQIERRRLRVPDSKTGAKNIELNPTAIDLLQRLIRVDGNPYVIVGRRTGRRLIDLQRPWQKIRAAANLSDVRIHDLRHSFASIAIKNGHSIHELSVLLGHHSITTTMRYIHLEQSKVADANDRIGSIIADAMEMGKREN